VARRAWLRRSHVKDVKLTTSMSFRVNYRKNLIFPSAPALRNARNRITMRDDLEAPLSVLALSNDSICKRSMMRRKLICLDNALTWLQKRRVTAK
jgi:hypothetical protein